MVQQEAVVFRSSAEAKYRSMAQTTCEMMWLKSLLQRLRFTVNTLMVMYCDNQAAIFIANNPTFHERSKHIEVDCYFIRDMVINGIISTPYTQSLNERVDVFTEGLRVGVFENLCTKLDMFDIYTPA